MPGAWQCSHWRRHWYDPTKVKIHDACQTPGRIATGVLILKSPVGLDLDLKKKKVKRRKKEKKKEEKSHEESGVRSQVCRF